MSQSLQPGEQVQREVLASHSSPGLSHAPFERLLQEFETYKSAEATYARYPNVDVELRDWILRSLDPGFLGRLKASLPTDFALHLSCNRDETAVEAVVILTPKTQVAFDVRDPSRPVRIPTDRDVARYAIDGTEESLTAIFAGKDPHVISCGMELVQWEMDHSSDPRDRIYTGIFGAKPVCFKVLRIFQGTERRQRVLKEFCHETLVWRQLQHPNVLPFLGHGNVLSYLTANPSHDRLSFVLDIVNGLNYLHTFTPPIIHGDIRCSNVLVQENLTCCLADFGLALVSESQPLTTSSGTAPKGSIRWCAPEVFSPSSFPSAAQEKRDIYAFACTVLEMYTGKPPFAHIATEYQVMLEIYEARRPLPPPGRLLPPELFTMIERLPITVLLALRFGVDAEILPYNLYEIAYFGDQLRRNP
ncbi:kinase-like domain-containing protein [Flagelloscypha sp. PMI_526]|nr:kinase-like domain-containing protein [Flagelloscypha sp. PMI_526]